MIVAGVFGDKACLVCAVAAMNYLYWLVLLGDKACLVCADPDGFIFELDLAFYDGLEFELDSAFFEPGGSGETRHALSVHYPMDLNLI